MAFFADSKLKRLDIGGGQPQTLTDAVSRGGTWSADGVLLFTRTTASPLSRVSASGGEAVPVTKLDRQTSHRFPQFLPDGRRFLFCALGTPETTGIYLGSLDSGETKRLTVSDTAGVYVPPGWLLWVRAGTLAAQRLDLARGKLVGDPVTVADPVSFDRGVSASALSGSATGLIAYRAGAASRRQLAWFDRSGKAMGTMGAPDDGLFTVRLSPDGRRAAVYRAVQGNIDIWLVDAVRTGRFTFDASADRFPLWSPDGSSIVFESTRKGTRHLFVKPASGAGSEELLLESEQDKVAHDWSTDGRFILFQSADPQTDWDLWVMPVGAPNEPKVDRPSTRSGRPEPAEGRKPWVFLKTSFSERAGQFSPDGRWVAYMSNESGRLEIYVRPLVEPAASAGDARPGGQWQVSTAGGLYPRWRHDGRELYYIAPDGQLMAASIAVTDATLEPGKPVALFQTRVYGGGADNFQGFQYDVARDGRFLINTALDDAAAPITVLLNWPALAGK